MKSCRIHPNKMQFPTAEDAREYMRVTSCRVKKGDRIRMNVYECFACGQFHLTSQQKKKSRRVTG